LESVRDARRLTSIAAALGADEGSMRAKPSVAVLLLLGVSACGPSPHEVVVVDTLDALEQLTRSLERVTDEDSATAEKPKLVAITDRLFELKAKVMSMKPTASEDARLQRKYEGRLEDDMAALKVEVERVAQREEAVVVLFDVFMRWTELGGGPLATPR
jgi:hypothetical protein